MAATAAGRLAGVAGMAGVAEAATSNPPGTSMSEWHQPRSELATI